MMHDGDTYLSLPDSTLVTTSDKDTSCRLAFAQFASTSPAHEFGLNTIGDLDNLLATALSAAHGIGPRASHLAGRTW